MKSTIKWMDDEGNEVAQGEATQALIAEYDDDDNLISETFGAVGEQVEEQVDEHHSK